MDEFANPFKGEVVVDPTAPKRTRRFKRRSRRGVLYLCLALVGVVSIGALVAKPAYRALKEWRAGRLVEDAKREFANEKWVEAMRASHAAYLLSPTNVSNLRIITDIFERLRSPRAIEMLNRVVAAEDRIEDRRRLVQLALQFQQLEVALAQSEALLSADNKDRENLLLAAQVARAGSDFTRELALLESARTLFPQDEEIAFLTARSLLGLGTTEQIAEAWSQIQRWSERSDAIGLQCLEVIALRPGARDAGQLAERLRSHPLANMRHLTLAADLEVRTATSPRDTLAMQVAEKAEGQPFEELTIAATWLRQQGEYSQILRLVPREQAVSSEELMLIHLDALIGLKKVQEVREILAMPEAVSSPGLRNFYQWNLDQLEEGKAKTDREARLAIDAAFDFPPSLGFMAARFEQLGRADLANLAYARLRSSKNLQDFAYKGLFRIAFQRSDTQAALALFEEKLREQPGDPWLQNHAAHFRLLLGRQVEESFAIAEKLAAAHPDRIAYRSTLALANLRVGRPQDAARLFADPEFDWRRALPATRAVYAATLRATGNDLIADQVRKSLTGATLFPEERSLLGAVSP